MTLRGGEAPKARSFAEISIVVREVCEVALRRRVSLGGREAPKALGFFGILGDASSRLVAGAKEKLSIRITLRGGEAEEMRSFAKFSRLVQIKSEAGLRHRVSLGGRESPKALGFFGIFWDAPSTVMVGAEVALCLCITLRGGEAVEARSFAKISIVVRETSEAELRPRESLGGRESPKALGFFGIFWDALTIPVEVAKVELCPCLTLRGGEAVEAYSFAEISRHEQEVPKAALTQCASSIRGSPKQLLRLLLVHLDAHSVLVVITQDPHRFHAIELHGALVQPRGLYFRFLEARAAQAVVITERLNSLGNVVFRVAPEPRQFFLGR